MPDEDRRVRLTTYVEPWVYNAVECLRLEEGRTLSQVVARLLEEALKARIPA